MPLVDVTNAGARPAGATKQGSITTASPPPAAALAEGVLASCLVAAHLRDPTFGLGDAIIATPALRMHSDVVSPGEGGGVCISSAPAPCVLEADGAGTCDGSAGYFRLGMSYLQGKGVPQDSARAVECFTKAADAGDSNSQFNLAVCYTQGLGCARDDANAFHYFGLAAAQGDPKAQLQIGVCHIVGRGTPLDEAEAAACFRRAAAAGDPTAQYNLGVCLGKGRGVEKDLDEAALWYRKSAEQGDPMAQFRLALCYATGKGIDKSSDAAVAWYVKAAEAKHGGALFNLGVCHAQGDGTQRDDAKAVKYYRQAAELGVVQAQHNLALCMLTGVGTPKDTEQAVVWYLKAAEQGDAKAQFAAGVCFEVGQGTEKNMERAAQLYRAASEQGNVKAIVALGLCYKTGAGVEQDQEKAVLLFEAAAQKGNHRGMYQLGGHYLRTGADPDKAAEWFKAAADKGNQDAVEALKQMADPTYKDQRRASRSSNASPPTEKPPRRSVDSTGKDSAADLTSTSTLLDQPSVSAGGAGDSAVAKEQRGRASESYAQPDRGFSCPGLDSSMGLSASQFDVPGRQSMAAPLHKKKNNEKLPSQLGDDSVEVLLVCLCVCGFVRARGGALCGGAARVCMCCCSDGVLSRHDARLLDVIRWCLCAMTVSCELTCAACSSPRPTRSRPQPRSGAASRPFSSASEKRERETSLACHAACSFLLPLSSFRLPP